jgi:hypothetical protein
MKKFPDIQANYPGRAFGVAQTTTKPLLGTYSYDFTGTDFIRTMQHPGTTNDIAISLWIRFDTVPTDSINRPIAIMSNSDGTNSGIGLVKVTGAARVHITRSADGAAGAYEVDDQATSGSGFSVAPSNWYHMVIQKNGSNYELWVNRYKVLDRAGSFGNADATGFDGLLLGSKTDNTNGIDGRIDHVKVYDLSVSGALTQQQIIGLYLEGATTTTTTTSTTTTTTSSTTTTANPFGMNPADKHADITLTGSNLIIDDDGSVTRKAVRAVTSKSSGRWYFELTLNAMAANSMAVGWMDTNNALTWHIGEDPDDPCWGYRLTQGEEWYQGGSTTLTGGVAVTSDIIMVAVNFGTGKIWYGLNGTWLESGDPGADTNPVRSNIAGTLYPAVSTYNNAHQATFNPGSSAFSYSIPDGFTSYDGSQQGSTTTTTTTTSSTTSTTAPGWLTGWDNRLSFTVHKSKIDAQLTNFPIMLKVTDSFFWARMGSGDSLKIAVTTHNGTTECYVEVERWDSS